MKIERFEDTESWQLGRQISQVIFELAERSELGRDFSLKDQLFRSSGSIMDNVAEGFDSGSNLEFIRFLQYSKRSCSEVQSQLYRALDRHYLSQDRFAELYDLVRLTRSKIGAFIKYLSQHPAPNPRNR